MIRRYIACTTILQLSCSHGSYPPFCLGFFAPNLSPRVHSLCLSVLVVFASLQSIPLARLDFDGFLCRCLPSGMVQPVQLQIPPIHIHRWPRQPHHRTFWIMVLSILDVRRLCQWILRFPNMPPLSFRCRHRSQMESGSSVWHPRSHFRRRPPLLPALLLLRESSTKTIRHPIRGGGLPPGLPLSGIVSPPLEQQRLPGQFSDSTARGGQAHLDVSRRLRPFQRGQVRRFGDGLLVRDRDREPSGERGEGGGGGRPAQRRDGTFDSGRIPLTSVSLGGSEVDVTKGIGGSRSACRGRIDRWNVFTSRC